MDIRFRCLGRRALMAQCAAAGLGGLLAPRGAVAGTLQRHETADPVIAEMVGQVSEKRLRTWVEALSAFPTRWSHADDFPRIEGWMEAAFVDVGMPAEMVIRQPFDLRQGLVRHNIIAGDPADPSGVVLLGAHFDSISEQPKTLAPGANDNASGIAVLLEACRILGRHPFDRPIVYAAFSGEEQGLIGSTACAEAATRHRWPLHLMVNLDMLGFAPKQADAPIIIEYDQGNAIGTNDGPARRAAEIATRAAAEFTTLAVEHTDIWNSDYMPFEAAGVPCIGVYDDGAESRFYHSTADLAEAMSFDRLAEVARLVVASLARLSMTAAG